MNEDIASSDWRLPDAPDAKFTGAEHDLLRLLHSREGKTLAHEVIWQTLCSHKLKQPYGEVFKVHVCRIRKKLAGTPWQIVNEARVGYRLERTA